MRGIGRALSRRPQTSTTTSHCLVLKRSRAGASASISSSHDTSSSGSTQAAATTPHRLLSRCLSGGAAAPAAAASSKGAAEGASSPKGTRAGVRPKGSGFVGRRGDTGRGWFQLYQEEGEEGFRRYRPPTPFDWEAAAPEVQQQRTRCYLEVSIDKEPAGRIVLQCADEILPLTARNFALLCQDKLAGSGFHKIVKDGGIVGGDLSSSGNSSGPSAAEGNHSALGTRFFHDEGFIIPHSAPGLVSMVSAGVHRNGSHFHISTSPCPHLDGRAVAFARVVEGMEVVQKVASAYSIRGRPVGAVRIEKAGVQ